MATLRTRADRAMGSFIFRTHRSPERIYLGRQEIAEMQMEVSRLVSQGMLVGKPNGERDKYLGLDVFRVDELHHLNVSVNDDAEDL